MTAQPLVFPKEFPAGSFPKFLPRLTTPPASWSTIDGGTKRMSAVGLIFFPPTIEKSYAQILLTKRTTTVKTHKGQIGFPGGRAEPGDASPTVTALREAEEEIGLPPHEAIILGALPLEKALDGSLVAPIVMAARAPADSLTMAHQEVSAGFSVPWPALAARYAQEFSFTIFGERRTSPLFRLPECVVWGLTAKILMSADLR